MDSNWVNHGAHTVRKVFPTGVQEAINYIVDGQCLVDSKMSNYDQ